MQFLPKLKPGLKPIILIASCTLTGLGISMLVGTATPLWVLLTFSIIYSIEKWGKRATRNKAIGIPYKLFLNILVLSLLGYIIWFGVKLFSHNLQLSPLVSSLLLVGKLVFFVWLCRILSKNSWRLPSMKLTVFSLLAITIIFAFAGVQPFSNYKTSIITSYNSWMESIEKSRLEREAAIKAEEKQRVQEAIAMMPIPLKEAPTKSQTESALTTTQALKIEEAEQEAFKLINTIREEAGIPPTKWNDELYKLSKQHTQDMANKGKLFHTPMGSSHGENAWGGKGYYHYRYEDLAKAIVSSWMSSPLHKAWLLHTPIRESVVSIVVTQDGQYASWSFWMNTLDRGPELIEKVASEWRNSGSNLPWIEWLKSKGYIKDSPNY